MLILLDIDGVMVPAKGWKSPELLNDAFPAFSNKATNTLQKLLSENTTIVLTTSHKANYSLQEWKNIFRDRGIDLEKIHSLPENVEKLSRKEEIIKWFNLNNVDETFVIIDDDKSLNDLPGYLKENLVLTSPYIGLTEDHLEIAQSILNKNLQSF